MQDREVGTSERIVFFDGVCNLCNGFVDFIVRRDTSGQFQVASLQGETAAARLPENDRLEMGSFVYLRDGQLLRRSTAALWILADLPGWAWVRGWLLVPAFLRDAVYAVVARNRYRWFGRRETCRLPTPEERARFLP